MNDYHKNFLAEKIRSLEQCCREKGLPVTVQRRVLMEALASRTDHPTADQIYDAVTERLSGISRTTVYRILDTFVANGMIRKIDHPAAKARFDADTGRHHHVRCTRCGAVADVRDEALNRLEFPAQADSGFELQGYSINFTGTCAACRAL